VTTFALLLAASTVTALAQAPTPSPSTAATPAPAAPAEKTAAETASPELVGELAKELAITPVQAQGGAATLFGVAKSRLSVADFAKVAAVVPNMTGLLAAAPAAGGAAAAVAALGGKGEGVGSMAAAAVTLSKLGIKPETAARFAPVLIKAVQAKGGADVGALLAGALK